MSILSGEFLLFLTALLAVYYIVPLRLRWCALTLFSLGFYAFAGWQGLCWLLAAALAFYGAALAAQALRAREERLRAAGETGPARRALRLRRAVVGAALAASMGALVFVKAASPLGALLSALGAGERLSSMRVLAPLGLSYCTFQGAGYLLDVAWGRQQAERHPLKFLLFMAFFPQLAQGPISTYAQLAPQLSRPAAFEPAAFVAGFERVIWGYFKKLVIADRLAAFAVEAGQPGWMLLLGAALYAVRLYADFSGGMDVALGAARMLGVELPENFRRPFFAQSVAEYWRRWHITLGAWFRAYLFYPLTEPHGASQAGQMTLSRFGIDSALRRSLPIETGVMKFFDLDRCYSVSRIPTADGRELCLYNLHLSAYTSDGSIVAEQLDMLLSDMAGEAAAGNYAVAGGDFNMDLLGNSAEVFGVSGENYTWAQPFPTELLPEGISLVSSLDADAPVASCRNADRPYEPGTSFTLTVDGFLVSDNVTVLGCEVVDEGFAYSDHNPVQMTFLLGE